MEPLTAVHALAASLVLTLGPVQFFRRRRDLAHRIIGRTWVGAMLITCATSFGIHPDGFNWLHGLAVFTLVSVAAGVVAILRRDVTTHRYNMVGSYLGTSIAFVFAAALPNRAIARMAVESPLDLVLVVALILATTAAIVSGALTFSRRRGPTQSTRVSGAGLRSSSSRAPLSRRPSSTRMASTSTSPGSPPAS